MKRRVVEIYMRVAISDKLKDILERTRHDIVLFNKYILEDEDPEPWKVVLREFFDPKNKYYELLMIIGRKGGKSVRAAKIALFFVYKMIADDEFKKLFRLVPDQPVYILVVSVTKDQAENIIMEYVKSFAKRSWYLRHFISSRRPKKDTMIFDGNIVVKAQGSSSRAMRGYPCLVVIFDEIGHFVDTKGNASSTAVYNAMVPNIAIFGDQGRIIGLTTPGAKSGITFELYTQKQQGGLPGTLVIKKPTWEMNPLISKEFLAREKEKNPYTYDCEYGAEFYETIDAFLDPRKIDMCVTGQMNELTWLAGPWDYFITLDPGLKHDTYSFALAHMEGKKPVIDFVTKFESQKGEPVQISDVENFVYKVCEIYPVVKIGIDQHQSASTVQNLQKEGLPIEETFFSAQYIMAIYERLRRFIHGKTKAVLPPYAILIKELKMLQIRYSGHRFAVGAPRGYTDDAADCVANILYMMTKDTIKGRLL